MISVEQQQQQQQQREIILSIGERFHDSFLLDKVELLDCDKARFIEWNELVTNFINSIRHASNNFENLFFNGRFNKLLKKNSQDQGSPFVYVYNDLFGDELPNSYTPSSLEEIMFFPPNIEECMRNPEPQLKELWEEFLVNLFPAVHRSTISNRLFITGSDSFTTGVVIPTTDDDLSIISSHNEEVSFSLKRKSSFSSVCYGDEHIEKMLRGAHDALHNKPVHQYSYDEENFDPNDDGNFDPDDEENFDPNSESHADALYG